MLLKVRLSTAEVLSGTAERLALGPDRRLYLAGQFRLDNRQALCQRLGLPAAVSDAELVGQAYLALGEAQHCAALLGDFAYALCDVRHGVSVLHWLDRWLKGQASG